jgi:hypothetical protein
MEKITGFPFWCGKINDRRAGRFGKFSNMGSDLTDKRWIVAKGVLFVVLALFAGALQLLTDFPIWQEALLLVICVWASCRFYYFLFHCLQAYVDPGLKSAGVMDLVGRLFRDGRVKLPVMIRADGLNHISEGWPSFSEARTKKLRSMCGRIAIFLTLVAAALPVFGVKVSFDEFSSAVPMRVYVEILCRELLAPVLLLLLEGLIVYCAYSQKRVSPWVVLIGWIGAFGLVWDGSNVSHDFSHALFDSCGGYAEFNLWLAVSIVSLITTVWLLEFRVLRGRYVEFPYVRFQMTKSRQRALLLLSVLVCWVAALYFLKVL